MNGSGCVLIFFLAIQLACIEAQAGSAISGSAKILLYHHVSDSTPAATSVSPATFAAHLELIDREGYQVVPLGRIAEVLTSKGKLSSRWVAITFDDAYESIASTAAPLLAERDWPFTVFVSTDYVDDGYGLYLSWDELRALETSGATIANHTRGHEHLVRRGRDESVADWQDRVARNVTDAQARLEAELKNPSRLFAYPYGEFTGEVASLMQSLGFVSFGQQSGPVGTTTNPYAIPRFPLAKGFDSVQSLAEKLRTEHLPLTDPAPPASLLAADAGPPLLELRIDDAAEVRPGRLNCFVAGQPNAAVTWGDTIRVQAVEPLGQGRSKYTCTAPHPTVPRAYYWHTHLYMKPKPDGTWYEG